MPPDTLPNGPPPEPAILALARARRQLIARRLPLFAGCWLATTVTWNFVLVLEGVLGLHFAPGLVLVQLAMLLAAQALCRAQPAGARVVPVVAATIVLLGVSSTVLFATIGADGDILAFVLLTLYLASSLFFAWGWRTALVVLVGTVIPWLAAGPYLRFYLPTLELATAIAIGSSVSLATAETSARAFATAFLRGRRERAATRALAASRDAYRDLAENASDLIYTHDLDGRFTYVNEAFARFAERPAAELLGRLSCEMVLDHPATPDIPGLIARVAAGETVLPQILPVGGGDRGVRWVECASTAIRGPEGNVVGVRGIGRDVTERKRAEDALRASLADLRRSEEDLRLLAQRQALIREEERKRLGFNLHDDVCQELVGIGILVESVRRQVAALAAPAAASLERVTRYLNEVVEHLRLLARDLRPLLLRDLGLESSLRSLAAGMSSPRTRVVVEFPTAIPRLDEPVEIGVYRIAQEALTNAVRHASARSIVVRLAAAADTLALDVCDDGCGFAADDRHRLDRLGLVGMQERALALGGRLDVWSAAGEGTTVHLECPLAVHATAA